MTAQTTATKTVADIAKALAEHEPEWFGARDDKMQHLVYNDVCGTLGEQLTAYEVDELMSYFAAAEIDEQVCTLNERRNPAGAPALEAEAAASFADLVAELKRIAGLYGIDDTTDAETLTELLR